MWNIVNNCHVRLWQAVANNVAPVAAPAFDGLAQLLTPRPVQAGGGGQQVALRVVMSPTPFNGVDIADWTNPGVGFTSLLAFVDDTAALVTGYWDIDDISPSFKAGVGAGLWAMDAVFLYCTKNVLIV